MKWSQRSANLILSLLLASGLVAAILAAINHPADAGPVDGTIPSGRLYLPAIGRAERLRLEPVSEMNFVTAIAGDGDGLLLAGERGGRVWSIKTDGERALFLDLSGRIVANDLEQGLLDIAFHPNFARNHFIYLTYTGIQDGSTHFLLSRYEVDPGLDSVVSHSEAILFSIGQESEIHNGGGLTFGPRDGRLYVGIGDAWLPERAQSPNSVRGKVVRLDVNAVAASDKPSLYRWLDAATTVESDVWASGLRNPWRITFDPMTNDLFIADVGYTRWEEVSLAPGGQPGLNFGWPCREGPATLSLEGVCDGGPFEPPIHAYDHTGSRCAIIGGPIYRQPESGRLTFLFGDFCSREIFGLERTGSGWRADRLGVVPDYFLTTFGQVPSGALYAGTVAEPGPIFRLIMLPVE